MNKSYIFNPMTGALCGESKYIVDVFGDEIIGIYQTKDIPPKTNLNEIARYLEDDKLTVPTHHGIGNASWVIHSDFVGTVYYDADGTKHTITEYNETVPDGCLIKEPDTIYHKTHNGESWIYTERTQHGEDRCDEVDFLLLEKLSETFLYNTYDWQVNLNAQKAIYERAQYAILSGIDAVTFPWTGGTIDYDQFRDASNTDRTFATASDFKNFAAAVLEHCEVLKRQAMTHKDNLRDKISYPNYSDVKNYDITSGW